MEDREAVRERMRRYREKKKGVVSVGKDIHAASLGTSHVEGGMEVILGMLKKIQQDFHEQMRAVNERLTALESREAVEPVVKEVQRRHGKPEPDLYKRVMAEKARRLMG